MSEALQSLIERSRASLDETRARVSSQSGQERVLISDPFDPTRPPHDPTTLPPGAAPSPLPSSAAPPPEAMAVDDGGDSGQQADPLANAVSLLGPARGGKKRSKAVLWEVIRPLRMPDDLPLLSQSLPAPRQNITQIRHSHHRLAQLLAQGTRQEECSHLVGYSPSYISILKTDPTFQELVAYYSANAELHHFDVIDRMRTLGLSTIDELQNRLEDDPSQFSNRELFEQAELTLVKPMAATRGLLQPGQSPTTGGGGISVNVNFIKSQTPPDATPLSDSNSASVTIDVTPERT